MIGRSDGLLDWHRSQDAVQSALQLTIPEVKVLLLTEWQQQMQQALPSQQLDPTANRGSQEMKPTSAAVQNHPSILPALQAVPVMSLIAPDMLPMPVAEPRVLVASVAPDWSLYHTYLTLLTSPTPIAPQPSALPFYSLHYGPPQPSGCAER